MLFVLFRGMDSEKKLIKIGQRIRDLRIKAGYTAYDKFAYDHGFDRQSILRAETGKNITLNTLMKILKVHKISLEDFFKGM